MIDKLVRLLALIALALAIAFLMTARVDAQELPDNKWEWFPHTWKSGLVYGSTAADFISTRQALGRGYVETNPVLGQGAARQAAIMFGTAWFTDAAAHWAEKQGTTGKVGAWILRGIHVGVRAEASIHNFRLPPIRGIEK